MKLMVVVCLVLSTLPACKDPRNPQNKTEENIYRSADKMTKAFLNKDWPAFSRYINPKMIARLGGAGAFEKMLASQMQQVPDSAIKKLEVSKIRQVVTTANDLQCVAEQEMMMQLQGMEVNSTTYLVGESLDNGKNWTFFDASNSGVLKPRDIKPDLSSELTIPEKTQILKR